MSKYALKQPVDATLLSEDNTDEIAERMGGFPTGRVLPEAPNDPVEFGVAYPSEYGNLFVGHGSYVIARPDGGWVTIPQAAFLDMFTEVSE